MAPAPLLKNAANAFAFSRNFNLLMWLFFKATSCTHTLIAVLKFLPTQHVKEVIVPLDLPLAIH